MVNTIYKYGTIGSVFNIYLAFPTVYICITLFLMGKVYLNLNKHWKPSNENVEDQTTGMLKPHKGLNILGLNWVKPTADAEVELAPVATAASDPVITTTN